MLFRKKEKLKVTFDCPLHFTNGYPSYTPVTLLFPENCFSQRKRKKERTRERGGGSEREIESESTYISSAAGKLVRDRSCLLTEGDWKIFYKPSLKRLIFRAVYRAGKRESARAGACFPHAGTRFIQACTPRPLLFPSPRPLGHSLKTCARAFLARDPLSFLPPASLGGGGGAKVRIDPRFFVALQRRQKQADASTSYFVSY